jgi:outer membrane protein assembly factor BamB
MGDSVWAKTFGSRYPDMAKCARETADGGFLLVGRTKYDYAGPDDIYMAKVDETGDLVWERRYGGSGYQVASSVTACAGGGYMVVGFSTSGNSPWDQSDLYLLKINGEGDTLWTETIDAGGNESAFFVTQRRRSELLITGLANSGVSAYDSEVLAVRIDSIGQVIRLHIDENQSSARLTGPRPSMDGGYIVTGEVGAAGHVYLERIEP